MVVGLQKEEEYNNFFVELYSSFQATQDITGDLKWQDIEDQSKR